MSWGDQGEGETAKGTISPSFDGTPAVSTVPTGATVRGADASGIAFTPSGDIYVWGDNGQGTLIFGGVYVSRFGNQFGTPAVITSATKLTYAAAVNAIQVAAANNAGYWLRSDHTLWAIGLDTNGAFGIGNAADTYYATPVQIASNVASFAVGNGGTSIATYYVDLNGNLYFSGNNTFGQAGNGTTGAPVTTFQQILGLGAAVSKVSTNGVNALAVIGGTLNAWGRNNFGQLGAGNTTNQLAPTAVAGLPIGYTVSDVLVSGAPFSYVLLSSGAVYGSGINTGGELGLGDFANRNTFTQATVSASLSVTALAQLNSSAPFNMAVVAGGKYWATGLNTEGQVDGTQGSSYNTFQNLMTFPGSVTAITLLDDNAVFVNVGSKARSWAFVVGL